MLHLNFLDEFLLLAPREADEPAPFPGVPLGRGEDESACVAPRE
jgi:hypothetical protein